METNRNWLETLNFGDYTVNGLYETLGVRDVLTTLQREGAPEGSGEVTNILDVWGNGDSTVTIDFNELAHRLREAELERGVEQSEEERSDLLVEYLSELSNQDTEQGREAIRERVETVMTTLHTQGADSIPERLADMENMGNQETQNDNTNNGVNLNEGEETVSLVDLFATHSRLSDLDDATSVVNLNDLNDLREETSQMYSRPNLSMLTSGLYSGNQDRNEFVMFGDEVKLARKGVYDSIEFEQLNYADFNNRVRSEHERNLVDAQSLDALKRGRVVEVFVDLFGGSSADYMEVYGFDKLGRYTDGRPYVKAMLATRFSKLYDRRFRKPEEIMSFSRNVAVANTRPSVKSLLELEVVGEEDGFVQAYVRDAEGERVTYLEDKLAWLVDKGFEPSVLVVALKTQFEFEDDITTLDQLKTLEFHAE